MRYWLGVLLCSLLVSACTSPDRSPERTAQHTLQPCGGPDADSWVTGLRDRVLAGDRLAAYATERYGSPVGCEGAVTTEFDRVKYGTLRLDFSGGSTYRVETMPPETSVVTLRDPSGFHDSVSARQTLETYAADIGLDIDWWSAPEAGVRGDEHLETYWDPDQGSNASASLIFRRDTLVGLRLSMAL